VNRRQYTALLDRIAAAETETELDELERQVRRHFGADPHVGSVHEHLAARRAALDVGRIELRGDRVYYVDQAGAEWRVHDVRAGPPHNKPGRRTAHPPPDFEANYRAFVGRDGRELSHERDPGEEWVITPERLARQLMAAMARVGPQTDDA
jgi:hypothetical protein